MAKFVGTVQEFHHFIGPRIRNAVNYAAASHRKNLGGICQECGQRAELQSAHVHGRGRREIIESVLIQHTRRDGWVECDLESVEREIIDGHMPIEETFKFICHPCHVAYDARAVERIPRTRVTRSSRGSQGDGEFKKLNRIELWAGRPAQANHQMIRAFLRLEQSGPVLLRAFRAYCEGEIGISGFNGKYASMETDAGNSYGKVFYDDGETVGIWPVVRRDIEQYF